MGSRGWVSRESSAEELRALFDELVDIDWKSPAWRGWLAALSAAEAWAAHPPDPEASVDAFLTALKASSGPVADTFMATHGPPPPRDRAGRIALASQRAHIAARTLARYDRVAPGQRLLKALVRRGGWLDEEILEADGSCGVAFVANEACFFTRVHPDDPEGEAKLRAALQRALNTGEGMRRIDSRDSSPTPAAVAISLAPVSQTWARSFHRAAWTRGGGPWMGIADSPPYEVVSTCHCAIDGYMHARIASEVLRPSARGPAHLASDPFAGVAGVEPPPVGFAGRVIEHPSPRFAVALHAFATVLDRHLGDGASHTVPFQIPIAPGQRTEASRWRRRPLYALMTLRRTETGELESPEALRARLPDFLAREASGAGLLSRSLLAMLAVPMPRRVRRLLLAGHRMDEWFAPARVLSGRGYLSWMRFPASEEPRLPTFPSAIPSFSVSGVGGCGLSITPFTEGLAVGLTTSGSIGTSAFAERFVDQWVEALPAALRGSSCTA